MKKMHIVMLTIFAQAIGLFILSLVIKWNYVDMLLLGSILLFGVSWLFPMHVNHTNNQYNAYEKGWTGKDTGAITPYIFRLNSIVLGQIIMIVLSIIITAIYYLPYFF